MKTALKILFAFLYDLLLLLAVWFAATLPVVLWLGPGFEQDSRNLISFQFYLIAITYLYFTHFWLKTGQTPGLRTWHLRLVREDGSLLTRHDANVRFFWAALLLPISWLWLFFSPKKQFLHDQLAHTKIIDLNYA
ncbi:RDD family protein [Galenea microaerophila]